MARQIAKGMTMLLLVVALAFVTAVVSANAQSSSTARATIPFDFDAGGKTLPAGRYEVSAQANRHVVKIMARSGDGAAMALANDIVRTNPTEKSKLVFRRYGNQYFLAEIWHAGELEGQKLLKSKAEKAIERELASIRTKSQTAPAGYELVEVALFRN